MSKPEGVRFFNGTCRGGPYDSKSMDHNKKVCTVFHKPTTFVGQRVDMEPLGKYRHTKDHWDWVPTNKLKAVK